MVPKDGKYEEEVLKRIGMANTRFIKMRKVLTKFECQYETAVRTIEALNLVSFGPQLRDLDSGSEVEEEIGCSKDVVFEKNVESTVNLKIDRWKIDGDGRG